MRVHFGTARGWGECAAACSSSAGGVNFFFFSHFRELPDFCHVYKASSVISVHILYHILFYQLLLVLQKNFGGFLASFC